MCAMPRRAIIETRKSSDIRRILLFGSTTTSSGCPFDSKSKSSLRPSIRTIFCWLSPSARSSNSTGMCNDSRLCVTIQILIVDLSHHQTMAKQRLAVMLGVKLEHVSRQLRIRLQPFLTARHRVQLQIVIRVTKVLVDVLPGGKVY